MEKEHASSIKEPTDTQSPSIGEPSNGTVENGQKAPEKRQVSSVEFPYNDLKDAIEVATTMHELGGSSQNDQLCAKLGYNNVENGAYKGKVSTARKFGVIATSRDGLIALTELGGRILNAETSEQAKVEAFLNVELFKKVYERYRGQTLPPDEGLENAIVQLGVSSKQKDRARQALQRSARVAGFFHAGPNKLVMPTISNTRTVAGTSLEVGNDGELAMLTKRIEELEKENERLRQNGNLYLPSELPQAIIGVLTTLPLSDDDRWTAEDLEEWTSMFQTVVKRAFRSRIGLNTKTPGAGREFVPE